MFFFFYTHDVPGVESEHMRRFISALMGVKNAYPQMTVGALSTLMYIAQHQKHFAEDGVSLSEIADAMGFGYSTLVRQVDLLGAGVSGRAGMDLVEKVHGRDKKERSVRLTAHGADFVRNIVAKIEDPH